MKSFLKILILLSIIISIFSCKKDDDISEISQEEQNYADDQGIILFLKDYYLDDFGKIQAYSSTITTDDNYPSLYTQATQDPSGFGML